MSPNRLLCIAGGGWFLAIVLVTAFAGRVLGNDKPPPNVVLIISDDQAWTDYGFMGHEVIQTPNLDKLARQSAVFTRGYVPTALCRPSLMTLATGLYAHQHLVTGNDPSPALARHDSDDYKQLREALITNIDRHTTLPKMLADRGYVSFQSGKWWEGNYRRGGFTDGMTRGFPQPGGRHGDDGLKIGREGMAPIFEFVDQAVADAQPFFLWYAPFLPHEPHNPPKRIVSLYRRADLPEALAKYYAMCHWFDETCGELIDHLDEKGVQDNTLIVYVTDNGWIQRTPATKIDGKWRHGFAPRSKQSPYECGVRTPIMLCWPGKIEPAIRDRELVSSIDIVPTILGASGVAIPGTLPGLDLLPVVRNGKSLTRDAIFGEGFAHDVADLKNPETSLLNRWCIEGRWKLLLSYDGATNRYSNVHQDQLGPQLFDLIKDPHENNNLAREHPEVVNRLAKRINKCWAVQQPFIE